MPATRTCPTCASEVPSDSPNEQCPRCLLELGLQDESAAPAPAELQGIDAVIDTDGTVTLLQPVRLPTPRRALVTILHHALLPTSTLSRAQTSSSHASWPAHYDLLHPLGEGGMGRTLKVRDRNTGRILCLKELKPDVDRRILMQECRALARTSHPGLIQILNFDLDAQPPYYLMEYIEGVTLARYLRQQGRLSEPSVLPVAERLFEAVTCIHSQALIHRDLKPGNIMLKHPLEAGLHPVILDFGLAIVDLRDHRDVLTAFGEVAGTAAYMAPEQLEARQLTPACDVYALGQILWEMMTGQQAFPNSLIPAITQKLRAVEGLKPPPGLKISRALQDLIRKCTRAEPAERPTAEQALAEVRRLAQPRPKENAVSRPWWCFWR